MVRPHPRRPRVVANFASTLDGKIAPSSDFLAGPVVLSRKAADHVRMRTLRASADAILIGAGNLRSDDPDLALAVAERARRRTSGLAEPMRIVVTRSGLGLSSAQAVFDPQKGGTTIVAHTSAMTAAKREELGARAELTCLGEAEVDVPALLSWLYDARGVRELLCEGGGILTEQLFRAQAVDELYLTLVPRILGGVGAPTLVEGRGFGMDEIPDGRLVQVDRAGDELFLRYQFAWP